MDGLVTVERALTAARQGENAGMGAEERLEKGAIPLSAALSLFGGCP